VVRVTNLISERVPSNRYGEKLLHRKKLVSVVAANQVFVVVTKSTGTASTVSASAKYYGTKCSRISCCSGHKLERSV
jgi:hypothetical protein